MNLLVTEEETRMARALAAHRDGRYPSLNKAALEWAVPYKKLQRRARGIPSVASNGGHNKNLSTVQEKALTDWMNRLIQLGFPPRLEFLRDRANILLADAQHDPTVPPRKVGKKWPNNFLARYPQYKVHNGAPLDLARACNSTHAVVNAWFHRLKGAQHEYGIINADVYNVDETGFQTGVAQRTKLVTWKTAAAANRYAIHAGDRTWNTSVECISADGYVLPPLLILPGQLHQTAWYKTHMPSDWCIATSETGWTNDNIAIKWLQEVFEPSTKTRTVGTHRLLVMDGHGSHVTAEFIIWCWDHRIVLLCLPPHRSHLLPPLDVSCFSPLKHYHSQAVLESVQRGSAQFDKIEFLSHFPSIRAQAFRASNIQSAFRESGLVAFHPSIVLRQLAPLPRPVTPPRPGQIPLQQTPKTLRQMQVQGESMLKELNQEVTLDPSLMELKNRLARFIKAAESSFAQVALQTRELGELRQAAQQRAARASYRRTYLQNGGVLWVEHALQLLEEKEAKEREEEEKKQRRAANQAARASRAAAGQGGQEQTRQRGQGRPGGTSEPGNHSLESMCTILDFS